MHAELASNNISLQCKQTSWTMRGGKQHASGKGEMADETTEFQTLVICPVRWPVESKSQKHNIDRTQQHHFRKIRSGEQGQNDCEFKQRGKNGKQATERKSSGFDKASRRTKNKITI